VEREGAGFLRKKEKESEGCAVGLADAMREGVPRDRLGDLCEIFNQVRARRYDGAQDRTVVIHLLEPGCDREQNERG
jgi:hypothetical protein